MSAWRNALSRLGREPLVQFLAIGALLFAIFLWRDGRGSGSNRIVITPGQVDTLVAGFARTWHRPPTESEFKALMDELLREEVATREAMALGLDRDDAVVRRRLRQKLEFVVEDTLEAVPPTDAELEAWLTAHPDDVPPGSPAHVPTGVPESRPTQGRTGRRTRESSARSWLGRVRTPRSMRWVTR